jgi:peptide/nickel transport system substrate-binding protein
MQSTGKRILCLLLAVIMLAVSGCTLPGTNLAMDEVPESTEGKDLTMGKAADNIFSLNINRKYSFNPLIATNHSNQLICSLVYENVVEVDNNFSVIPGIATEWECNDSATSWLLTIDNTRTFHDGTPVTARDVRYSIDRAVSSDRYLGRFSTYQGAAQDGDDKLYITLSVGDTQFIKLLNVPVIKYGTYDEKYPTGSGPYTFSFEEIPEETDEEGNVVQEASQKLVSLVGFEGHRDYETLPVDTVYLKEYTEAEDIINAFEDSYIDVVINDPSSYTNLGYASTNEIHTYATTNMHFVCFNQETRLGAMSGFRYAMQYAFNRAYLETLLNGNAVASAIPMYPTCAEYPSDLNSALAYNLERCRIILENNGIRDYDEDGFMEIMNGNDEDLVINFILCSDSSAKAGVVNRFAADMLTIGIKVNVQELTWTDYYNALTDYENLTKEQLEDEDFKPVEFDMYYAEVKLRNNFDITQLLQERGDNNKGSCINYSHSFGNGYETYLYNYLASGDSSRKNNYRAFAEYVLTNAAHLVVIGFEKQQIISHRQAIRGIDANMGNPLYNFAHWTIIFKQEDA